MPKKRKKTQNRKWETNPSYNTKSKSQYIRDIHMEINKLNRKFPIFWMPPKLPYRHNASAPLPPGSSYGVTLHSPAPNHVSFNPFDHLISKIGNSYKIPLLCCQVLDRGAPTKMRSKMEPSN